MFCTPFRLMISLRALFALDHNSVQRSILQVETDDKLKVERISFPLSPNVEPRKQSVYSVNSPYVRVARLPFVRKHSAVDFSFNFAPNTAFHSKEFKRLVEDVVEVSHDFTDSYCVAGTDS